MTKEQAIKEFSEEFTNSGHIEFFTELIESVLNSDNKTCRNCLKYKNSKGYIDCVIAIQVEHRPNFYCVDWETK